MPADPDNIPAIRQKYLDLLVRLGQQDNKHRFFDFEKAFPPITEIDPLIQQVDDLKKCLDSFRPLNPEQAQNLSEALDVQYTYQSNRIEGNTLTLQETALVLSKGMTISGKTLREHLEATNHAQAIEYIKQLVRDGEPLIQRMILNVHQLVLAGIDRQNAGRYRTVAVAISGGEYTPPPFWFHNTWNSS